MMAMATHSQPLISHCQHCSSPLTNGPYKRKTWCDSPTCRSVQYQRNLQSQARVRRYHGMLPWDTPRPCRHCHSLFTPRSPLDNRVQWCYQPRCQVAKDQYWADYRASYNHNLRLKRR